MYWYEISFLSASFGRKSCVCIRPKDSWRTTKTNCCNLNSGCEFSNSFLKFEETPRLKQSYLLLFNEIKLKKDRKNYE